MLVARAKGKARLASCDFQVPSLHVRSFQPSLETTWRPMEARRNATLSLMPRRPRNHSRIIVSHEAHSYFTRLGLRPHFSRREHRERPQLPQCDHTVCEDFRQSAIPTQQFARQKNRRNILWSLRLPPHSPNANRGQTSTPPSAPTTPSRSTAMPSNLSQHQAAHAVNSPDSAGHRALQTTELLENILVHLPIKDLFVHQKVSKRFQATIAESPAIRRKMFLTLSNTPRECWRYVCQHRWDGRRRRLKKLAFEVEDPTATIPRDGQLIAPVTQPDP
jgi:hypothetical protein